jgi:hypothetical protein
MQHMSKMFAVSAAVLLSACVEPHATGPLEAAQIDAGPWENVTGNLAGHSSECGTITFMTAPPASNGVVAGISRAGLWARGVTDTAWTEIGQGSGSVPIINRPSKFVYDPDHPLTWWESGIYNSFGVYRTDDDGVTFTELGLGIGGSTVNCCDSISVDFSDPARQTIIAGSHEAGQHMFRSDNGGGTWTDIGSALPADSGNSGIVQLLDTNTYLVGTSISNSAGIFRTTDRGATFTKVANQGVRSHPLVTSDGTIYVQTDNNQGVLRSIDHGVTWTTLIGPNILFSTSTGIIELPGGRVAALALDAQNGKGHVVISPDDGVTFAFVSTEMPIVPNGLLYSQAEKALYVWRATCDTPTDPVSADAIQKLLFP